MNIIQLKFSFMILLIWVIRLTCTYLRSVANNLMGDYVRDIHWIGSAYMLPKLKQ